VRRRPCATPSTIRRYLVVDQLLRGRRHLGDSGKQRSGAVSWQNGDGADRLAHAPAADHLARDLRELLDVGLGAGADLAEDDLLRARPPSATLIFATTSGSGS
jgi:hypothetical protein